LNIDYYVINQLFKMLRLKIFTIRNLFISTVVLYLLIVLLPYAFVTHDGPSHLYNAYIINKLLFSNGSIYEEYHALNPNWVQPNLVGYFIDCTFPLGRKDIDCSLSAFI
jgi:hypothetical protein